jgi:hypothetical protein
MDSQFMVSVSFFPSVTDTLPRQFRLSWEDLVVILEENSQIRRHAAGPDPKKALPALSGATYSEGHPRGRAHVTGEHLLCLDVDNSQEIETGAFHRDRSGAPTNRPIMRKVCLPNPLTPEMALARMAERSVEAFLYTTWSHRPEWPRFRVVVPLAFPIEPDLWPQATEWALRHLGLDAFRKSIDLPALRDVARLYFLPACPPGGQVLWRRAFGEPLEIPTRQLKVVPVPSPALAPWQLRIIEHRAKDRGWKNRYQCDLRTLDLAGLMRSRGVEVGEARSYGPATKWRTHCPWAHEHTQAVDDDSGVIIHESGRFPVWRCAHAHHAHLGFRDVLDWAGGAR